MDYILVNGTFHVVGFEPDGDSIRFKANNGLLWDKLIPNKPEKFQKELKKYNGAVQLRLLGIDALETHYLCNGETFSQPNEIGKEAAETLMKYLGVQKCIWTSNPKQKPNVEHLDKWEPGVKYSVDRICLKDGDEWWTSGQPYVIPGFIVASKLDKNGRPLAWVFPGASRYRDGKSLRKDDLADIVKTSANYHLLKNGLVFPFFFEDLDDALRDKLAQAAKKAAKDSKGVWVKYTTLRTNGLNRPTIKTITKETVMLPYLYRKLIDRYKSGSIDLKKFPKKGSFLATLIEVEKEIMRMKMDPWDVVFEEW